MMARIGALALVAVLAMGAKGAQAQTYTDVIFCNNTGSDVYIAFVYYNESNQRWQMFAYELRPAGVCDSIAKLSPGLIYYHAFNESRRLYWPNDAHVDKEYCLPNTAVDRPMYSGTCIDGEELAGFQGIKIDGPSHTINIDP